MGPTERVARARTAVAALGLPAGARVVVACSGGADSLALAATTAHVAPRAGWLASAAIVDHSLRADSASEAVRAAALCESLGLPAEVRRVRADGPGGPEAAARDARYAALADVAGPDGLVLLGHTLDDQAETVLLGLARGSGARSLAGMAASTGRYRRPLLALTRADTAGICADLGLVPVEDPTNQPDGPWRRADGGPLRRTALRHHVIPALEEALGGGVIPALARTADLLRADADYLEATAAEALAAARIADDGTHPPSSSPDDGTRPASSSLTLAADRLAGLPDAVRTRVLHRAIMDLAPPGARGAVGSRHVEAVDRLLVSYRGQGPAHLPGFVVARREGDRLVIAHEPREE
nr:tRNA lysidine(34) synthetase TilS [Actinomycetales bacterium]